MKKFIKHSASRVFNYMTLKPIKDNNIKSFPVDLTRYPNVIPIAYPNILIVGDLHGNTVKMLYTLLMNDIVRIHPPEAAAILYENFVQAFTATPHASFFKTDQKEAITKQVAIFDKFLETLVANPNAPLVIFVGDELLDRAGMKGNDICTIKLFEFMHRANLHFQILASNHGFEFYRWFEKNLPSRIGERKGENQAQSFSNMCAYILPANSEITQNIEHDDKGNKFPIYSSKTAILMKEAPLAQTIRTIYAENYLPHLSALSYVLSSNKKSITLCTHAPVGLDVITGLSAELGVDFNDKTPKALAKSINYINAAFQNKITNKTLIQLFQPNSNFFKLLWHRVILADETIKEDKRQRPANHPKYGYDIFYVHGHDSRIKTNPHRHIINLDNHFGANDVSVGNLEVFITQGIVPLQAIKQEIRTSNALMNSFLVVNPAPSEKNSSPAEANKEPLETFTELAISETTPASTSTSTPYVKVTDEQDIFRMRP